MLEITNNYNSHNSVYYLIISHLLDKKLFHQLIEQQPELQDNPLIHNLNIHLILHDQIIVEPSGAITLLTK